MTQAYTLQESVEAEANIRFKPLVNQQKEQKTTKLDTGFFDDLSKNKFQFPYIKYWSGNGANGAAKEYPLKAKRASPSSSKRTLSLMKMLTKMKAAGFDIRTHRNDKV